MKKIFLVPILFLFLLSTSLASNYDGDYISKFAYNSSGSESAIVNCASYVEAKCRFYIQPPNDEIWDIHRLIFSIGDQGVISSEDYGGIANGLTNGVVIRAYVNGEQLNLTNDQPVLENAHWGKFMYDIAIVDWGSGEDYVQGRWTFANSGTIIRLNGSVNDSIEVLIQDDLTSLHQHSFLFQGHVYNPNSDIQDVRNVTMETWMILMVLGFLLAVMGQYLANWALIIASGVWFIGLASTTLLGLTILGFSGTLYFVLIGILLVLHGVSCFYDKDESRTVRLNDE